MPDLQVGVFERVLDADPRAGVEGEQAVQKIQGVRVCGAEERVEGNLLHAREVADVVLGAGGADAREGFLVGGSQVVQDLVELVDVVAAFEEGLAAQELGEDAAYRPDVDWDVVSSARDSDVADADMGTYWLWCSSGSST